MYNTLGFTDKTARDEEWTKMRATGMRGVVRYTTHDQNHPQIIYVLAYPVSEKTHIGTGTDVPLTDAAASENMVQDAIPMKSNS
jgi:hypothetical protein